MTNTIFPVGTWKFPLVKVSIFQLTEYFDRGANEYKYHDYIEFKLKIICEKLDEIAKDENGESGVEDTDDEEFKNLKINY